MALFYVFNIKAILQKVPGPFRVCLYGAIWRPVPATSSSSARRAELRPHRGGLWSPDTDDRLMLSLFHVGSTAFKLVSRPSERRQTRRVQPCLVPSLLEGPFSPFDVDVDLSVYPSI